MKFAALERLKALQPKAITTLETLLNRDEFPTVQMAAVRDVLDRTEGKASESVTVNLTQTVNIIEVLRSRHQRQLPTVEIIEHSYPSPQAGDTAE